MDRDSSPSLNPIRFPTYLRSGIATLFAARAGAKTVRPDADFSNFLVATNRLLKAWDEPALPTPESIPEDFPATLRDFIDSMQEADTPFTHGVEARVRNESTTANVALATFFHGLSDYLAATRTSITTSAAMGPKGEFPFPAALDPANERPRLWKRVVTRQANGEYQSRLEEVQSIDFSKKPIITVGGLSCFHNNARGLNGFMKTTEEALGGPGIYAEGVEIYTVSHPIAPRALGYARSCSYNADPLHYASASAQQFVAQWLLPYLGVDGIRQKPLSLPALKEKLGKVNFFGYSYGTVFVKEVANVLSATLAKAGYTPDEIRDAFAEVYSLNVGLACRIDIPKPCGNFSSLYAVSARDRVTASRLNVDRWLKHASSDKPAAVKISDNELLIWTPTPAQGLVLGEFEGGNAGGILPVITDKASSLPHAIADLPGHSLHRYFKPIAGEGLLFDPGFIAQFLRNMLMRPAGKPVEDMFQPLTLASQPHLSERAPMLDKCFAEMMRRASKQTHEK